MIYAHNALDMFYYVRQFNTLNNKPKFSNYFGLHLSITKWNKVIKVV